MGFLGRLLLVFFGTWVVSANLRYGWERAPYAVMSLLLTIGGVFLTVWLEAKKAKEKT